MLDSNVILGVNSHLGCKEYEHGILIQNWEVLPLGAPIVYGSGSLERRGADAVRVLTLITPSQMAAGMESVNVYSRIIAPTNLKPLYKNHKVLTVSQFDIGKFDHLTEFVRDVGGISLIIKYEEGRRGVIKSLKKLEKIFKYTSLFYYNRWSDKHLAGDDDHYLCVLTFLDLPYCVPLFNTHKVDGIGLCLSGALHKASIHGGLLNRTFRADLIYSNYEDNVLVIDGVNVNSLNPPNGDIYKELAHLAGKKLEIGPFTKLEKSRPPDKYVYGSQPTTKEPEAMNVTLSPQMEQWRDHGIASAAPAGHFGAPTGPSLGEETTAEEGQDDGPESNDVPENKTTPEELNDVYSSNPAIKSQINTTGGAKYYTTTTDGIISVDTDTEDEDE